MPALYFRACGSISRRSGRFERRCAGAPAHRFRKNLMPSAGWETRKPCGRELARHRRPEAGWNTWLWWSSSRTGVSTSARPSSAPAAGIPRYGLPGARLGRGLTAGTHPPQALETPQKDELSSMRINVLFTWSRGRLCQAVGLENGSLVLWPVPGRAGSDRAAVASGGCCRRLCSGLP